jgi:DNA processing protein
LSDFPPDAPKMVARALPRDDAARLDWLRLARSRRVGPATFLRLMAEHGSAAGALEALPELAAEAGAKGYAPCGIEAAEAEWAAAETAGAVPLFLGAADYPAALAGIGDPPPFLWALGDPGFASAPMVALVGARNASALGVRMATRLAKGLGEEGFVVVSGLARGIDAAAHRAALESGTVAVHAGGVDDLYPPENAGLAAEIAAAGLRLSEMPMGLSPQATHFPRRNRIVAGLARAVVVVEGAERSGSLITARCALEQGREVMAVPGNPLDARAGGCNALIREGATLVRSAADIVEALGSAVRAPDPAALAAPDPAETYASDEGHVPDGLHDRLLALMGPVPVAEDILIRETGAPAAAVAAALLDLELAGEAARHAGGTVSRPAA